MHHLTYLFSAVWFVCLFVAVLLSHKHLVEQEMLSYASSLYGRSLIENTQGKNSIRRQAMMQFLGSARSADIPTMHA